MVTAIDKKRVFTIYDGNEVYQIYSLSNKKKEKNLTYIDLDECGYYLRKKLNMKKEDDIIVFKIEYYSSEFRIPIIEYSLYAQLGTKKISINECKNMKFYYYIPKIINDFEDYKYNPQNIYYKDKCIPFTSENGTDTTLMDRMEIFNQNSMSLCESMCTFKGYIENLIMCECNTKLIFNSFLNLNVSKYNLVYRFKEQKPQQTNFWVLECYLNIFTKEIVFSNLCSQIILGIIFINLIGALIYFFKGHKVLYQEIKILIHVTFELGVNITKKNNINNKKAKNEFNSGKKMINLFGNKNEFSNSKRILNLNNKNPLSRIINNNKKSISIIKNSKILNNKNTNNNLKLTIDEIKKYREFTDNELNSLSYYKTFIHDKRTFIEYYISLIRTRNIFIFAFNCRKDYNSRIIKVCYIFFIFALYFFINITFINDNILHYLSIFHGKLPIKSILSTIITATLISSFLKNILMMLVFTEDDILEIK